MKSVIKCNPIYLISILCANLMISQDGVAQSLRKLHGPLSPKDNPSSVFAVTTVLDSIQKRSASGIIGSFFIKNNSSIGVTIDNPINYLNLHLMESPGKDIYFYQFPAIMSDRRLPSPSEPRLIFKHIAIANYKLNAKTLNVDSLFINPKVFIAAHGEFEIEFQIPKMLNPSKESTYEAMALLPGKYSFFIQYSISQGPGKLEYLLSDPLTIKYGVE